MTKKSEDQTVRGHQPVTCYASGGSYALRRGALGQWWPKNDYTRRHGTPNSRPSSRELSNGSGCFLLPIKPVGTPVCNAWNPPPPDTLPGRHSCDMEMIPPPWRSKRGHRGVRMKNLPTRMSNERTKGSGESVPVLGTLAWGRG